MIAFSVYVIGTQEVSSNKEAVLHSEEASADHVKQGGSILEARRVSDSEKLQIAIKNTLDSLDETMPENIKSSIW